MPYNIALIDLEEGPRIVGTVRGIANEDIEVGTPVEVAFEDVTDTFTLPIYLPTKGELP